MNRRPTDWERDLGRPRPRLLVFGAVMFLIGAALMAVAPRAMDVVDFMGQHMNVYVIGQPSSTFRILGGIIAIFGVISFWVGLPERGRSRRA